MRAVLLCVERSNAGEAHTTGQCCATRTKKRHGVREEVRLRIV
jgi:hypothetical protein